MRIKAFYFSIPLMVMWLMALFPEQAQAQDRKEYHEERYFHKGDTLRYRILYPKGFSEREKYPVMLFLHQAGERGSNNKSQLTHGGDLFLQKREEFPAIVIFPQAPRDDYWAKVEVNREVVPFQFNFKNEEEPTTSLKLVMRLMDSITSRPFVNARRVYLGGLSMGGMGTYELLSRKPEMFAAAFAICGGADPAIVRRYSKGFNIWIFHGEKDDIVVPEYSKTMAREINSQGGNAKLSLYPNDNHNSWDSAFAEPYLLPWLFSIKRMNRHEI